MKNQKVSAFNANEKFLGGQVIDGVKIAQVGDFFKDMFLGDESGGRRRSSQKKGKTIAEFWEMLKKQGLGQAGQLSVDQHGHPNRVRVCSQRGESLYIYAIWTLNGWSLQADSVDQPRYCIPAYEIA